LSVLSPEISQRITLIPGVAVTENVTPAPIHAAWLTGWVVIVGASDGEIPPPECHNVIAGGKGRVV